MKSQNQVVIIAEQTRSELLRNLKREVKQIMEESVTRKFVNEESNSVTSLCAVVEACLSHGLKKRVLGLFGSTSTFGLLLKVANTYPPATAIVKAVLDIQKKYMQDANIVAGSIDFDRWTSGKSEGGFLSAKEIPVAFRYLWLRLSLFEKMLAKIVEHIASNASKYYDKDALMADPIGGTMVASLLVGPCALEFSKLKTQDHMWTDPPANELMQRHRIGTRVLSQPLQNRSLAGSESPKSARPALPLRRRAGSLVGSDESLQRTASSNARGYVQSLHQNYKSSLLYGKNNVTVQPPSRTEPMKGYLSLQQQANGSLCVRWTPNELMHSDSAPAATNGAQNGDVPDKSFLWNYAICLNLEEIVYLHVHQKADSGGSIVFVGADGVQYPPIQFPTGQHPLAFLSCLENGLLPWSQLDPPLWLQKGKGKVFPKLKRKSSMFARPTPFQSPAAQVAEEAANGAEVNGDVDLSDAVETADYVFRIIPAIAGKNFHMDAVNNQVRSPAMRRRANELHGGSGGGGGGGSVISLTNFSVRLKERFQTLSSSGTPVGSRGTSTPCTMTPTNSLVHSPSISTTDIPGSTGGEKENLEPVPVTANESSPKQLQNLQSVCDSMKHQIVCRAFYGWLAHCRHLRTVRTHLACLIYLKPISSTSPTDAKLGLTRDAWESLKKERNELSHRELCRLVYFGGVENDDLRREVWPYLLEFHSLHEAEEACAKREADLAAKYEATISTWSAVEAIVRERDIEAFRAARCSRESQYSGDIPLVGMPTFSVSTEHVFADADGDDESADTAGEPASCNTTDNPESARHESADSVVSEPNKRSRRKMFFVDSGRSTPEAGDGGLFSKELIEAFALNLHRIEKDVHRCDRNLTYFSEQHNLDRMKNLMCTFVWEHLDLGYIQGMVDLAAPLLVLFDDEVLAYGCFTKLMERMSANFPHGGQMDVHFANMRALMQVLDPELFDLMHQNGDCTHFYFCYRWFLLDFKRELVYKDVNRVWECIWAAREVSSPNFVLFLALALVQYYREVLLENVLDFTDIIKFFNEMAEKHNVSAMLQMARDLVEQLQTLIESNAR